MKISEYPAKVKRKSQYTTGDLAKLFGVSTRTAVKMIDCGQLESHTIPGGNGRRVHHATLEAYLKSNPQYSYVLAKFSD